MYALLDCRQNNVIMIAHNFASLVVPCNYGVLLLLTGEAKEGEVRLTDSTVAADCNHQSTPLTARHKQTVVS